MLGVVGELARGRQVLQVRRALEVRIAQRLAVAHDERAGAVGKEQPLVRIERDGVAALDALEPRPAAVGELEEPAVGGVDMHPEAFVAATSATSASGSIAPVFVVPAEATTMNGRRPARRSSATVATQRLGVDAELGVGRHDAQVRAGEARDRRGLRDAGVRLLAHVVGAVTEVLAELRVPCRDDRGEVRERAAGREQALRAFRILEQVAEPPRDVLLDRDRGRPLLPEAHEAVVRHAPRTPRAPR